MAHTGRYSQFDKILSEVNEALRKYFTDSDTDRKSYETLFETEELLRRQFYSYFRISGATLVVADILSQKIVLLQEEIIEAVEYPKLKIPISKDTNKNKSILKKLEINYVDINVLCNRI